MCFEIKCFGSSKYHCLREGELWSLAFCLQTPCSAVLLRSFSRELLFQCSVLKAFPQHSQVNIPEPQFPYLNKESFRQRCLINFLLVLRVCKSNRNTYHTFLKLITFLWTIPSDALTSGFVLRDCS